MAACGRWPCGRAASSRVIATATSSTGPWRQAEIRADYSPAQNRGNGSYSGSRVTHTLVVHGRGAALENAIGETMPATRNACEQPFTLAFSPDGQVVGISRDGGHAWRFAGLSEQGVLSSNQPISGAAGNAMPAWPTTKQLAIDALHGAQTDVRYGQNVEPGESGQSWGPDSAAVARFACAHLDDTEIRAALALTLDHATTWRWITQGTSLMALAGCFDATRTDGAWRTAMLSALVSMARDPQGDRDLLTRYASGCPAGASPSGDDPMHCLPREALAAVAH